MCTANVLGQSRCVNDSIGTAYDLSVPKVVLEHPIIREEQSCSAHPCQRDDVFVIGTADALGSNCLGFGVHNLIRDAPCAACLQPFPKYSPEFIVIAQFTQILSSRDKNSSIPFHQPFVKILA